MLLSTHGLTVSEPSWRGDVRRALNILCIVAISDSNLHHQDVARTSRQRSGAAEQRA